jgi:hypothetical protein
MGYQSIVKNQHFISQAEQRLNSMNPSAHPRNQKIFNYSVIDRDSFSIKLVNPKGEKIGNNLSYLDLYSFERIDDKTRENFENLFVPYEANITNITKTIIIKMNNNQLPSKEELKMIYGSKMLNFLRNPLSIAKAMNTFGKAAEFRPTDDFGRETYDKIINGRKPHQKHLCERLGISDANYIKWLRMIFMMLFRFPGWETNMFDSYINNAFEDITSLKVVTICTYADNRVNCLLSDRGYSTIKNEETEFTIEFNLSSSAHIGFSFFDIKACSFLPEHIKSIPLYKSYLGNLQIIPYKNNLTLLKNYNSRAIYQCFNCVLSSSSNFVL